MKMIFNYYANKTHFHNKGFALSLVLKVRFFGTRKRPISTFVLGKKILIFLFIDPSRIYLILSSVHWSPGRRVREPVCGTLMHSAWRGWMCEKNIHINLFSSLWKTSWNNRKCKSPRSFTPRISGQNASPTLHCLHSSIFPNLATQGIR